MMAAPAEPQPVTGTHDPDVDADEMRPDRPIAAPDTRDARIATWHDEAANDTHALGDAAPDAAGPSGNAGADAPLPSAPDRAAPTRGLTPSLAAALVLVAGILHLYLVDVHMAHARGVGLFFLAVGIAQTVWAVLYLRNPGVRLARIGAAALVVAPTVLYVVTRVMRAPWSGAPEPVDVIGITTQVAQLGAGLALWLHARPTMPRLRMGRAVAVGALLAVASYGGAIASEGVDWLSEAELSHGDAHALGVHGDAHGAHAGGFVGVRGENLVGSVDYFGPKTGSDIDAHCRAIGQDTQECWLFYLTHGLTAHGSIPAFETLNELVASSTKAEGISHPLAHVLGHHAYQVYGLDIDLTLAECSYEVFQGCIHGALQAYFSDLASQGMPIDGAALDAACDYADTRFESYACLHGVGHGVMMYTGYALHDSLDLCAELDTGFARSSCYGGVVMENVVGYFDSKKPGWEPHDHGNGPPTFWVDPENMAYPCDVVDTRYGSACWRMQTSLILHFNGGDFQETTRICEEEAGQFRDDCHSSVGRDAVPYGREDPLRMMQNCSYGTDDARQICIRAVTSGVILQHNSPQAGLDLCPQLSEEYQEECYRASGRQATSMLGTEKGAAFCDPVPDPYRAACEEGRAA